MTYTYTFVRVPVRVGAKQTEPAYEATIHEYAKQGWRFVQLVIEVPAVVPTEYVLIFERVEGAV